MSESEQRQAAEAHFFEALDHYAEGRLEDAVSAYQRAVQTDERYTDAMHGLCRALQDLERHEEAIAVAQRITELDPEDILSHTSLSILYQKKGLVAEAEAEANRARILGWKQQLKNPKQGPGENTDLK